MDIITQIVEVCVIPLLGILVKFLVDYLNAKSEELKTKTDSETAQKYIDMITQTITDCVIATNQTYTESLKAAGEFTEEAQTEAFNRTMTAVLTILSEDAKEYITETTGDLNTYLTQRIEAEVKKQKA